MKTSRVPYRTTPARILLASLVPGVGWFFAFWVASALWMINPAKAPNPNGAEIHATANDMVRVQFAVALSAAIVGSLIGFRTVTYLIPGRTDVEVFKPYAPLSDGEVASLFLLQLMSVFVGLIAAVFAPSIPDFDSPVVFRHILIRLFTGGLAAVIAGTVGHKAAIMICRR